MGSNRIVFYQWQFIHPGIALESDGPHVCEIQKRMESEIAVFVLLAGRIEQVAGPPHRQNTSLVPDLFPVLKRGPP
jgi:hypothetical protein